MRSRCERHPVVLLRLLAVVVVASAIATPVRAQEVSLGLSTIHDENIFDVYLPFPDQLTQLQLDASKDWDLDDASLGLSYTGTGVLFRDLTSRSYHAHAITFSASHQFVSDDADEESEEEDSAAVQIPNGSSSSQADSLDRFLYGSLFAGSQFNQEEFSEYNNTALGARASLRLPLGAVVSATPSYTFSYHSYPNLSPITNIQNILSVTFGGAVFPGTWVSIAPAYEIKSYPTTSTYTITVTDLQGSGGSGGSGPGHGNGGGASGAGGGSIKRQVRTFTATSPSVNQFLVTVNWEQKMAGGTRFSLSFTRFGNPSAGARLIPQQLQNIMDERQLASVATSQSEIFNDHFAYRGNEARLHVEQALPLAFLGTAEAEVQGKTFSSPAMDLSDSVQLAEHREDSRAEFGLNLSRPVTIGGRTFKPQFEVHVIRNSSNAPFYDFDKTTFLVGIEYTF